MDLSKHIVVQRHSYLPIFPIWACPWAKNMSNQAALGPDFAEPIFLKPLDGFMPFSSVELSGPVVVQYHGHLTLTLDFQGQILKMLYFRNWRVNWHGTKEMWVDRRLDWHYDFELWPHPWPWPWIFKVNFLNSCISGTGGPINMEQKGYRLDVIPTLWP